MQRTFLSYRFFHVMTVRQSGVQTEGAVGNCCETVPPGGDGGLTHALGSPPRI